MANTDKKHDKHSIPIGLAAAWVGAVTHSSYELYSLRDMGGQEFSQGGPCGRGPFVLLPVYLTSALRQIGPRGPHAAEIPMDPHLKNLMTEVWCGAGIYHRLLIEGGVEQTAYGDYKKLIADRELPTGTMGLAVIAQYNLDVLQGLSQLTDTFNDLTGSVGISDQEMIGGITTLNLFRRHARRLIVQAGERALALAQRLSLTDDAYETAVAIEVDKARLRNDGAF